MPNKSNQKPLSLIILLIVLVLFFFLKPELIDSSKILRGGDFDQFFYWAEFFKKEIFSGELPFWDSYTFSGRPFLFNLEFGFFYPLNLIFLILLSVRNYLLLSMFIHLVILVVSSFLLARHNRLSEFSCLVFALTFSLGGFFIARIYAGHLNLINSAAWLPLIFLYSQKFIEKRRGIDIIILAILFLLQFLAGFPTIFFLTLTTSFLFISIGVIIGLKSKDNIRECLRLFKNNLASGLLLLLLFLGLIAFALLPSFEIIKNSSRWIFSSEGYSKYLSLPPKNLITLLFPDYYGNYLYNSSLPFPENKFSFRGEGNYWEFSFYMGILPVLLFLIGLGFGWRNKTTRYLYYFSLFILIVSLLLAFGKYTPIYSFFYRWIPFYQKFRIPAQHLFIFTFAFSFIGALGAEKIREILTRSKNKMILYSLIFICLGINFINIFFYFQRAKYFLENPPISFLPDSIYRDSFGYIQQDSWYFYYDYFQSLGKEYDSDPNRREKFLSDSVSHGQWRPRGEGLGVFSSEMTDLIYQIKTEKRISDGLIYVLAGFLEAGGEIKIQISQDNLNWFTIGHLYPKNFRRFWFKEEKSILIPKQFLPASNLFLKFSGRTPSANGYTSINDWRLYLKFD